MGIVPHQRRKIKSIVQAGAHFAVVIWYLQSGDTRRGHGTPLSAPSRALRLFFLTALATTQISTLSLPVALPILASLTLASLLGLSLPLSP